MTMLAIEHHYVNCGVADAAGPSTWEILTTVGTLAAVLVAIWAVVSSQRSVRKERTHQRLVERHRDTVELLAAFESIQRLRAPHYADNASELDEANAELKLAGARCVALIRASEEPLPITRGMFFRHIPYGAVDPVEAEHLRTARKEGNPETDTDEVMWIRAEIVEAIDGLRRQLMH